MSSTKAGSECHADGIVVGIPQVEVDLSGGQSIDHADAVQWCDPDGGPGGTRHESFVEYNKQRHLAVENSISGGGFTTVSLRPGAFARNAIRFWARQIRHNRMVGLPFPDSQQAPIADEDIAAVAVRAITTPDLDGTKPVLTGPDSLTMRDQVRLIGEAIGEPIGISVLSEREARALYGEVLPPEYLDLLMAQWEFETTEQAVVTHAVHEITGRDAVTYLDWAMAHRDAFV
ncbi:hypothetical protein [Mycolicibacterium neoaurum]|uniref:hypothetical protein n=1 Tax=Mycolicibacterium neoaurum TaxID=1795 RepID=UPI001F3F6F12|nr:hypothetical protein [Mycolicibacterium neoaurum]